MDADHPIPPPPTGSAARSPPRAPNPAPSPPPSLAVENRTVVAPRSARAPEEPAAAAAARSSPRSEAENQTATASRAFEKDEAVTGSSVRSPLQAAQEEARHKRETSAGSASSLRSRLCDAENPPASPGDTRALVLAPSIRGEAVTGSSVRSPLQAAQEEARHKRETSAGSASSLRSPLRDAENPPASPGDARALVLAPSIRGEAVAGSPVILPQREVNCSPSRSGTSPPRYEKEDSFKSVSSYRSPLRDAENPTALAQYKESVFASPMRGAMTVGSILQGPLANVAAEDPSLEKPASPMVAMANRMVSMETTSATKLGERGGGGRGSTWVEPGMSQQPPMRTVEFGLRILALILSMISFSVMAADKTSGWDGDSFDRYREFRYCFSVNVLVFVYSLFQIFVQIFWKIKKKWIMSRPVIYYFNLSMDQILAYLLMSASSSAASRNGDWVNDFGSDKFTKGINGSIAMSFLAFFALAFSSIISAYKFFSSIS